MQTHQKELIRRLKNLAFKLEAENVRLRQALAAKQKGEKKPSARPGAETHAPGAGTVSPVAAPEAPLS